MPITFLVDILFGRTYIKIPNEQMVCALNVLHKHGIVFANKGAYEKDSFLIIVQSRTEKKVLALLDKNGIKDYSIRRKGLPFFIKRYTKRPGLVVGVFVFALILWVSEFFVWEITFSGNEMFSDYEVEQQLAESGFGVGTFIPKVDSFIIVSMDTQN